MKLCAAFILAGLAPLTSGCVAAAVPLAASAMVASTQLKRSDEAAPEAVGPPPSGTAPMTLVPTALTELPRPSGAGTSATSFQITAFERYVGTLAATQPGGGKRESALLGSASELRVKREDCADRPPAVFIDLDPGRGSFDPLIPGVPEPGLAAVLASLRRSGVGVVWFSRLGENFAEGTRRALRDSGLDPHNTDQLVLMRDIGERKHSRREEMATRLCPIALLGDERADFDELYLYLRDPEAATALDAMIGRGWFLASPFAPAGKLDAGAAP